MKKQEIKEGTKMTVYEAFCKMAQWLLSEEQLQSGKGEICLIFNSDDEEKAFFGQQWRLALDIKKKLTGLRFSDKVEYLGFNQFKVVGA